MWGLFGYWNGFGSSIAGVNLRSSESLLDGGQFHLEGRRRGKRLSDRRSAQFLKTIEFFALGFRQSLSVFFVYKLRPSFRQLRPLRCSERNGLSNRDARWSRGRLAFIRWHTASKSKCHDSRQEFAFGRSRPAWNDRRFDWNFRTRHFVGREVGGPRNGA